MIIRKPYAFLIKNFRRIHIALLIIGLFIFSKIIDISSFVNNFMSDGFYDLYADPITKHITPLLIFSIFLMIIGSVSLLLLLLHKKKPWKTYIIPAAIYISLFFILGMIRNFFGNYTERVDSADLRLSRDLLIFLMVGQVPALAIYVIRIFGLDVNKFEFNSDIEMMDLSDADREEIEVSLDLDVHSFKRYFKKLIRNIGYFYKEHKIISKIIIGALGLFMLYNAFVFVFITNKTYKQGQSYRANGYTFKVNKSYYTDKDASGNVISNDSNFVIVEVTVKNNSEPRNLNTSNFHLHAGKTVYESTEITYANEFDDLGKCYRKVQKLQRDEEQTFILVFKVNKKIRKGRFVLYYQEKGGIYKLRKISLKIKDIRKIEKTKELKLGENFDISLKGNADSISIEKVEYLDSVDYKVEECSLGGCKKSLLTTEASDGHKIMKITFSSDYFESKNMIDFLKKYGRINYKDSKGKEKTLDIKLAVSRSYLGKNAYLSVPDDFEKYKKPHLCFTIRNNDYCYLLA